MAKDEKKFVKAANPVKTITRLLKFLKDKVWFIVLVLVLTIAGSLLTVYSTHLINPLVVAISHMVSLGDTSSYNEFIKVIITMGVVYLSTSLVQYFADKIMVVVTNQTLNKIRNQMYGKMQELPISYFDTNTHGELMSYYTNDVGAIRNAISDALVSFIYCVVTLVSTLVIMISISPVLTIVILVLIVVMSLITKYIGSKSIKNYSEQQANVAKINGYMEEMMGGQKVVKVFTHEDRVKEDFIAINEKARIAATKADIYAGIMGPISNNLSHINYAACSIFGAYLCITGRISIASLIEYLQHTKNFSQPLSRIMQQFNALTRAIAGAERIFNVLDLSVEEDDGKIVLVNATYNESNQLVEASERTGLWAWKKPVEDGFELIRLRGDVKFNNVDFSYDGVKQVLNDISFYAKPGQKIAFVGATGAGKTTITNLINRFYDINDGEILYDGINVKDIKKASLRSSLAMVLQDTHLFTGTIMENIRYGNLDASDEQVIEAAKLANADEFITMLEDGYNTVLTGDAANLSQGQRQLLAIARAAVCNSPVLILDEATSSIDTRTEKLIETGMDNLMAGRTVFVIAHRLSTVRNANAIMVLDNGSIIERGDHEDLIKQKGKYYSLYTGQFELD